MQLFLPDREPLLDLLDHVATRGERLVAVRRGGNDTNARLAHRHQAEPMLQRHAGICPPRLGFVENSRYLGDRHVVVGGVVDAGNLIVAANGAEEGAGAAAFEALKLRGSSIKIRERIR
jgi:hypothetical protein